MDLRPALFIARIAVHLLAVSLALDPHRLDSAFSTRCIGSLWRLRLAGSGVDVRNAARQYQITDEPVALARFSLWPSFTHACHLEFGNACGLVGTSESNTVAVGLGRSICYLGVDGTIEPGHRAYDPEYESSDDV